MGVAKKILVAPLDWGLGHASRCIPLIKALLDVGAEVVIAADNGPMLMLNKTFPEVRCIRLEGYPIRYPLHIPFSVHFAMQLPAMQRAIRKEHIKLQEIQKEEQFDAIISDNRYGVYLEQIPSVIITHQLQILNTPFASIIKKIITMRLSPFHQVWVPDVTDTNNLSGRLSHGVNVHPKIKFIGPLSHFSIGDEIESNVDHDLLVLLSGPEPHRSVLEKKVIEQLLPTNKKVLLISGLPNKNFRRSYREGFEHLSYLDGDALKSAMLSAKMIIARSAYSTIMDLAFLNKSALLIPTPGQQEQQYLANYLDGKVFNKVNEKKMNLNVQLDDFEKFKPLINKKEFYLHKSKLNDWLESF